MDNQVNQFRLASRELFNNYFLEEFLINEDWDFYEKYTSLEELLFSALVTSRTGIDEVTYGLPQPQISVIPDPLATSGIPIMLNRDIDSGYWDHSISCAIQGCTFTFISFFDWNERSFKDHRYVRTIVKEWPNNPELIGKQALIETHYVLYKKA